jgi:aspartyl-tRNA(Asn)/glutamyl-tRNA(Gln) amidotransferase subunit A
VSADPCGLTAVELAAAVRRRELSPVDVVEAVHRRMDRLEPHLHAFCHRADDRVLEAARALERSLAAGAPGGPLCGVPIGVKDLVAVAGMPMAGGSPAYRDYVPDEDDVAVERLHNASAIVLGKTAVTEFGYSGASHSPVAETVRNPWNPALTSGGSSAGSGAAVAAGLGPVAIAADGGGSIRIPASFCGLFGMKASMGRVPMYPSCRDERLPGIASWEGLEHVGPVSRTVADAALVLSVIAGPDERDRHSLPAGDVDWRAAAAEGAEAAAGSGLRGLRVAFSADLGYVAVDPEVARVVREAVSAFEQLGCEIELADPGFPDPGAALHALIALETDLRGMREIVARHGHEMSPHLVDLVTREWRAEEFTDAITVRKAVVNAMWRFMRRYDLVLTPTLTVPPFPIHMQGPEKVGGRYVRDSAWLSFTAPFNLTGQPAATVPAGFTDDGLPVGLQIAGRHLDDGLVLRAAAAFEAARPWAQHRPPLAGVDGD